MARWRQALVRLTGRVLDRLGLLRATSHLESVRRLFAALAVSSVLVTSPSTAATTHGSVLALTLASIAALIAAVLATYRRRRPTLPVDVVLALGLLVLAHWAPTPGGVFALTVAMLWFRSLYGSTWGAYVRGVALVAITAFGVVTSADASHDDGLASFLAVAGIVATAFLGITGARFLRSAAVEREQELDRHTVQAWAGSQLLGLTEPQDIKQVGWDAIGRVVAATPGMHVLRLATTDHQLRAWASADDDGTAVSIDVDLLERAGDQARIPQLDAVVGSACTWRVQPVPDRRLLDWLAVGFEGRVSNDALNALDGLTAQVTLSMRNSDERQKLTLDARVDGLTGLANRTAFETALLSVDSDLLGHRAVLFVDLDDFKDVNDTYGHFAGDTVLREVAVRLRAATRADDLCVRLGGDEFAVLSGVEDPADALELGRRIVALLELPVDIGDGAHAQLGASVGVATAALGLDPMCLVRQADIAMYAAKGAGKCTVRVYSPDLHEGASVRTELV